MLTLLHTLALFCIYSSIGYYVIATVACLRFARRAAAALPLPENLPTVVLLKPLNGFSDNLMANVASFFAVEYPQVRYVFGLSSPGDESSRIVEAMRACHPDADVTVVYGHRPSVNRKVGKLMAMIEEGPVADVYVMSDADVMVERDYLKRIIGELCEDNATGIVTCVYRGRPGVAAIGARLEALFINTDFAPIAIATSYFETMRHAFASTVAIRRNSMEEAGGLGAVKDCYGDDLALARRVCRKGYKVRLSSSVVTMVPEERTFADFFRHQLRWARVDRRIRPISLGRILINGPLWALAIVAVSGLTSAALANAALALIGRFGMTVIISGAVHKLPVAVADLFLVLFKDLAMAAIWCASLTGNTVEWTGRKLRLLPTGEMEEVRS